VTRGANSGRNPAGNKTGEIEWDISVDYDNRGLINHSPFSEASNHAECTHIGSIAITASVGAVQLRALGDARTFGAEMMQTSPAPAASSAARNKRQYDMITRFYPVYRSANFFDYTSRLVTKHHRPHRYAALTAHHMVIGAAQAHGRDAYQNFSSCRSIELDGFNRYRCTNVTKNDG
jgi:hypothetical protein